MVTSPSYLLLSLVAAATVGGCRQSLPENGVLATRIERQVVASHPDVRLERYARFYAHGPNASIQAVYVYANVGYEPMYGRSGQTVWTTPAELPVISDGGCTVLNIEYDAVADALRSVRCN